MFLGIIWGQTGAMKPLLSPEHLYVREEQKADVLWGRAELAGGALQLSQDFLVISTNLAASSIAPLHPPARLRAGPKEDEPHFYVFLELSSVMKPIWILEEAMDFLETWSKETAQLFLNHRFFKLQNTQV